ncbi:hypothetical protein RD055328_11360 [Companilactobacillus sp. RD055328]|uniref:DUF4097 family beta strand repeat-containing protein n=1 Tax=Companilactobacillus sp. RD055328 TaxID=2916634 RepID=UPI001FC7CA22|nr:DUF4097 family beta strand repeat-containing protein [Companilactobacillus sp. RD055328]GKQ43213.1 hypothetical protein RD055328_11360 [Companilactobacillus sp. RD055328]
MKKYYIITSIVLFFGMLLAIVGLSMGGFRNIEYNNGHMGIAKTGTLEKTKKFDSFKNLEINGNDGNVKIVYGTEYSVRQVSYKNNPVKMSLSNDTLSIDRKENRSINIGFSDDYLDTLIEVTIPRGQKLDNIKINNYDSDIIIGDDLVNVLTINSNDSDVDLSNVNLQNGSKIELTDGEVKLQNSTIEGTQISTNTGDIELRQVTVKGRNNYVDTSDGEIEAYQITNAGIIANVEDNDEEIDYQGREYRESFKNDENNANLINLNSRYGEISIR